MRPTSYFQSAMEYPESLMIPRLECDCLKAAEYNNDPTLEDRVTIDDDKKNEVEDDNMVNEIHSPSEDIYVPILECGCGILSTHSDKGKCNSNESEFWRSFFP